MNEKIHNTIREFRKKAGLTQEELADEMRVSRQTINSIELGRYIPSLPLALRIARFFGCSTDEMFHLGEDRT
jgi:putative transcriptional regulator